jgi:membrane associated rhomboid family serine protease
VSRADPQGGLGEQPAAPPPAQPQPPGRQRGSPTAVALLVVLALAFLVQLAAGRFRGADPLLLYRLGALHWPSLAAGDWWRLGGYSFLHVGLLHFALNAWALWLLMPAVEAHYGGAAALGTYAAAVLGAGAASAFSASLDGAQELPGLAAGASGGIAGLFGAQLALLFRLRGLLPPEVLRAWGRALLINLLLNGFLAFEAWLGHLPIDNAGHAGGLLTGVAAGLVAPLLVPRPGPLRRTAGLLLVGCALVLAAMEGTAAARAAHPATHRLRGPGLQAELPFPLVQLAEGRAGAPAGVSLSAEVAREQQPLALAPGADVVRLGRRSWLRRRRQGTDEDEQLQLLAADGPGRLRITVSCAQPDCRSIDEVAEQLGRTLELR